MEDSLNYLSLENGNQKKSIVLSIKKFLIDDRFHKFYGNINKKVLS
ncbi:hypothetical protein STRDD10_00394 [Streptococcus sp. DD10]|nr:hypothetical protein STRDD10_00394 [Streptococcus sp. DD10]